MVVSLLPLTNITLDVNFKSDVHTHPSDPTGKAKTDDNNNFNIVGKWDLACRTRLRMPKVGTM